MKPARRIASVCLLTGIAAAGSSSGLVPALSRPSLNWRLGAPSCAFVLHWDANTLDRCTEEIRSDVRDLRLQVQMLTDQNCLLARELEILEVGRPTSGAPALVAETDCAKPKARAGTKKPGAPNRKK